MKKHELNFLSEYYQFYILDAQTNTSTDDDDFWTADADEIRLAVGEGLLGVTTGTYGTVKSELFLLDASPKENQKASHIVEASLSFPSGKLEIRNCTGYEVQFSLDIEKTDYRVRISSFNLDTADGDLGDDYYTIELWKSKFDGPKLIKKYEEVM
jgi:hypothetical protein